MIEIVVVGPGEQFYSLYGHLGVLVWENDKRDPKLGKLFNFGMTNFSEDGYFGDFLGGRVQFWGDVRPYGKYLKMWTRQDRSITRYQLNLAPSVSRALYRQLKSSITPENRYFVYDTFRQNCATKVRDLVDTYTAGSVYRALNGQPSTTSYRDDVRAGYSRQAILLFLTEWFLGASTDQIRTPWELSYRPVYFGSQLPSIRLQDGTPLVSQWFIDHERVGQDPTTGWHPWLSTLLCVLGGLLLLLHFKVLNLSLARRITVFSIVGTPLLIFSMLQLTLHFWTAWPDARNSWMLLCLCPLDVLVVIAALRGRRNSAGLSKNVILYSKTRLIMTTIVCLASFIPLGAGPLAPRLLALCWWIFALGLRKEGVRQAGETGATRGAMDFSTFSECIKTSSP